MSMLSDSKLAEETALSNVMDEMTSDGVRMLAQAEALNIITRTYGKRWAHEKQRGFEEAVSYAESFYREHFSKCLHQDER